MQLNKKKDIDTKEVSMDQEIKKPELERPTFFREPFDYRNIEYAGQYRGVGEAGKIGLNSSSSMETMPAKSKTIGVPRDHKG